MSNKMGYNLKKPYRIVMLRDGHQQASMGAYHTELQASKALYEMSKTALETVKFPRKYRNEEYLEPTKYELLLIKKKEGNEENNKIKNEYGEYIEHTSNMDYMWQLLDKVPYAIEDSFWVYGYHPISNRKDANFILNELVEPKAKYKSEFLNVKLYLNKILLESTTKTDLVLCKNKSDAIRLYNLIEEHCIQKKFKYCVFYGDCGTTNLSRTSIINKIQELTNWTKKKITRTASKDKNGNNTKYKKQNNN